MASGALTRPLGKLVAAAITEKNGSGLGHSIFNIHDKGGDL